MQEKQRFLMPSVLHFMEPRVVPIEIPKILEKADSEVTSLQSASKTLVEALANQEKDEKSLRTVLDETLRKQRFESVEEMLPLVVGEVRLREKETP